MSTTVILINTLAEFVAEVPPPAVVRLNLTENNEHTKMFTYLHINLNLQALNDQGHVVWLHDSHTLEKVVGSNDFWRPAHKSIYRQMPQAQRIVRAWLTARGYEVRGGQFGLPADIKPVRGAFECVDWVKENEETFRAEPAQEESQEVAA
ncbi:MAG: hypothetical protein BroJett011_04410 [Chloroflexota bacterium]|nr:MAG: hypothetical protein BroJett011_04410 [Chloroflexota bacterium]